MCMNAKSKPVHRRAAQAAFSVGVGVVVVVWLSLLPRSTSERFFWEQSDYLPHVIAYAALAIFASVGFQRRQRVLIACFGLVVLGLFLEIAQQYVPGRSPRFGDIVANVIGVVLGLAAARVGERVASTIDRDAHNLRP